MEPKSTWTLKDKGNSIHVSNAGDPQTVVEFDCNTTGAECAIKRSGHKAKVSMWFNGTKLVELETMGNQVVKRRFTVTGDGDTMELETIPMVPSGSSETTHFKRIPSDAFKKQSAATTALGTRGLSRVGLAAERRAKTVEWILKN